jgi:hypothetical protein
MKMDFAFLLVAAPMEKSPKQHIAGNKLIFRPQISDRGPQRTGPQAKPILRTNSSQPLFPWLDWEMQHSIWGELSTHM